MQVRTVATNVPPLSSPATFLQRTSAGGQLQQAVALFLLATSCCYPSIGPPSNGGLL